MTAFTLKINGRDHQVDVDPNTPLLWAIRDNVGLTGTKYACGVAQCGACTVYVDGQTVRSCSLPVSAVGRGKVTTIEGLDSKEGAAVQKAWVALDVPQCGFCQSGQIMSAAALLSLNPTPTDRSQRGERVPLSLLVKGISVSSERVWESLRRLRRS